MPTFNRSDSLHRLVKQALDSGKVSTLAEAEALFRGYRIGIVIDDKDAYRAQFQAALLTTVALARRVFLGGVFVEGRLDVPLSVPLPFRSKLSDAVVDLGAVLAPVPSDVPVITISKEPRPRRASFHIRTAWAGWRGGVLPVDSEVRPLDAPDMPLAAMLAAALAVNEAFIHVDGGSSAAGRQLVGLSMWNPSGRVDWLSETASEPELKYLPSRLWLIGLGHLGQAYLWGLALLPYQKTNGLSLVLQDVDVITPSTESTSILTDPTLIGQKKTRAVAAWAERRGFSTSILERYFSADFKRQDDEPMVALCGLDNALGRRALDQVGFKLVVEAGLGMGYRDFRTMRIHTLPGSRPASDLWRDSGGGAEDVADRSAYRQMLERRELDRCGVTLLAGKAVGAPFVGSVAACLVLSEVLRLLHGGGVHQLLDVDLQSVEHRSVIKSANGFESLNPGYVPAI